MVWVDGSIAGKEIRRSLQTRNWEDAQKKIREWESEGRQVEDHNSEQPIEIEQAGEDFLADAQARKLHERTIYKYRFLFRQLNRFSVTRGLRFLKELDTASLRAFRATWKDGDLASLKKLERLKTFCRFAQENKWIDENPAARLSKPKVAVRPTLPFTQDEMIRILSAMTKKIQMSPPSAKDNARRLRALALLLRYTGLRIGDAVSCSAERLSDGKLRLYTQKTGTHVHCPLPDFVVDELNATPKRNQRYWFWTGACKLKTAVTDWQGRLQEVFDDVQLADGHAHRFRDTFATELLLEGVPLERVSILLGHTSIRVTEKHYSPWIRARQEQAEADIRRTWSKDPVVLLETKGTLQVHERDERPN